jgi:mono/diheme cytochrome c family protein
VRRCWLGIVIAVAFVLCAIVSSGLVYLRAGVTARAEPSRAERIIARAVRNWTIPSSFRSMQNPMPDSAAARVEGMRHFADHCASCHGNDGSGRTEIGQSLYPRAPDMRQAGTQSLSDGELFYFIENGIRLTGMPAWSRPGQEAASWALVRFIRHLPALTPGDRLQMNRLNPRGPEEWKELEEEDKFLRGAEPLSTGPSADGHHH